MTNTELLKKKIKDSGFKLTYLAKTCGITYPCLLGRLKGESEFRANEMRLLSELIKLSDSDKLAIFFANNVDETSTEVIA